MMRLIHPSRKPWSAHERTLLRSHYRNGTQAELLALLPHRSYYAIKAHAIKLGVRKFKQCEWSTGMDNLVRESVGKLTAKETVLEIRRRYGVSLTPDSIYDRRCKLKVTGTPRKKWAPSERFIVVQEVAGLLSRVQRRCPARTGPAVASACVGELLKVRKRKLNFVVDDRFVAVGEAAS